MAARQMSLDFPSGLIQPPAPSAAPTKAEKFEAFLVEHPWFIGECRRMALEHKFRGNKRWSTKAIFELLRHRFKRTDKYGLDNSYTSFVARRLMEVEPRLKGFFELR